MTSKYRYDVCLDTNIVIKLATTDKVVKHANLSLNDLEALEKAPNLSEDNRKEIRFLHATGTQKSITELYTAIEKGWINAIITPTVFEELENGADKHGFETLEFLKNSRIRILNLNNENRVEFYAKTDAIAEKYAEKIRRAKMTQIVEESQHNNHKGQDVYRYVDKIWKKGCPLMPINDAIILAESALLGLPLVTDNTKDFIHDHRQDVISHLNQRILHLGIGVKPLTSKEVMEIYKHRRLSFFTQHDSRKWKTTLTREDFVL